MWCVHPADCRGYRNSKNGINGTMEDARMERPCDRNFVHMVLDFSAAHTIQGECRRSRRGRNYGRMGVVAGKTPAPALVKTAK